MRAAAAGGGAYSLQACPQQQRDPRIAIPSMMSGPPTPLLLNPSAHSSGTPMPMAPVTDWGVMQLIAHVPTLALKKVAPEEGSTRRSRCAAPGSGSRWWSARWASYVAGQCMLLSHMCALEILLNLSCHQQNLTVMWVPWPTTRLAQGPSSRSTSLKRLARSSLSNDRSR